MSYELRSRERGRPRFNNKDPQGSSSNPKYLKFQGLVLPKRTLEPKPEKVVLKALYERLMRSTPALEQRPFVFVFLIIRETGD